MTENLLDNFKIELSPTYQAKQRPGLCEASLGGNSFWKMHDWQIQCSRRPRYNAVVHLTDHPDDAYKMVLCGQHEARFRKMFQVEAEQIPGWKPDHGHDLRCARKATAALS